MGIIIFSKPIHSGKTSSLLQWCEGKKGIEGILMPDINGKRKMLDIATQTLFDAELTEETSEPITEIGKYKFYTAAFERANDILLNAIDKNPAYIIIDEVGKLEMKEKGFYKAVVTLIELAKQKKIQSQLILVVRDSFVEEVCKYFKIEEYVLTDDLNKLQPTPNPSREGKPNHKP